MRFAVIVGLLLLAGIGPSDLEGQATVRLVSEGNTDAVGNRLAYQIREQFRRSTAFSLSDNPDATGLRVLLLTMDPDSPSGTRTVYSVVWAVAMTPGDPTPLYLHTKVGIVGANRIEGVAEGIVATTDDLVRSIMSSASTSTPGSRSGSTPPSSLP